MYETQELLGNIDDDRWWILAGFGIAMVFQWIWLIECVRLAKRERVYTMPLFCTFFWFAHDTGCVARFDDWFNTYDHWYLKCFWFGLLTAAILEVVFFAQVVKYGKDELLPGVSTRTFVLGLVGIQIATSATWEYFKDVMDDPLYQLSTPVTVIAYPLLGFALMLRRRSTIGQNVTMWWSFTAMTVGWFVTTGIFYGDAWRSWQHITIGVITTIGGLTMTYLVSNRSTLFPRTPLAPSTAATATSAVPA